MRCTLCLVSVQVVSWCEVGTVKGEGIGEVYIGFSECAGG